MTNDFWIQLEKQYAVSQKSGRDKVSRVSDSHRDSFKFHLLFKKKKNYFEENALTLFNGL